MRFGLTILPELPWREAEPRWRAAEELGFDHAWTYDHLVWGGLPDSPWYGTTPTLTAAALVTSRIRLGTFVVSPNYRHPVAFHRDVQSLDDISAGRFLLGVGTGGDLDSGILGGAALTTKQRVDRFQEFTRLLLRLRDEDHVTSAGTWFSAQDARTLPKVREVPILVAANGPRSLRFAGRHGDGWVTTGTKADTLDGWYAGLAESARTLEETLVSVGRDPSTYPRYLNLDSSPRFALESADLFTDVITHWPRADGPYAGSEATLDTVASHTIPSLRG